MPSVDVAMARSLQPGSWERLTDAIARGLGSQMDKRDLVADATDKVTDIKTALSSWDNCMAVDFCKWPLIAIIAVGGLIIFAILSCIIRCACCAKSCCCSCFSCFKCCGNCCGCCDEPGSRKHKYLDEPYIPPHQGYRTEAPMHAFPPAVAAAPAPAPVTTGVTPPQYAQFDMKKGGEDSLPQMPSWEGADSKKVEVEEQAVEMDNLNKPTPSSNEKNNPFPGGPSPSVPTGPVPMENPQHPYGHPNMPPVGHPTPPPGRMMPMPTPGPGPGPGMARDPYSPNNPYDSQQDGFGLDQPYDQPYDLPPAGMAAIPPNGRSSPGPGPNGYGRNSPGPGPNGYGRNSPGPGPNGYGRNPMDQGFADMPSGSGEYGPQDPYRSNPSPGPGMGGPHGRGMGGPPAPGMDGPHGPGGMGGPPPMGGAPGYGMHRGPGDDGYGSRTNSPGPGHRGFQPPGGPNRGPNGSPAPYGMDPRMRNSPGPRGSPRPPADPYGRPPRSTPTPVHIPGGGHGGYGSPTQSPIRDQFNRSYSPAPERQYTQSPRPMNRGAAGSPLVQQQAQQPMPPQQHQHQQYDDAPTSPFVNNSGFDFTSGFARPQTADHNKEFDRRPSESNEPGGQEGYPGYKPYRPVQEGWNGV